MFDRLLKEMRINIFSFFGQKDLFLVAQTNKFNHSSALSMLRQQKKIKAEFGLEAAGGVSLDLLTKTLEGEQQQFIRLINRIRDGKEIRLDEEWANAIENCGIKLEHSRSPIFEDITQLVNKLSTEQIQKDFFKKILTFNPIFEITKDNDFQKNIQMYLMLLTLCDAAYTINIFCNSLQDIADYHFSKETMFEKIVIYAVRFGSINIIKALLPYNVTFAQFCLKEINHLIDVAYLISRNEMNIWPAEAHSEYYRPINDDEKTAADKLVSYISSKSTIFQEMIHFAFKMGGIPDRVGYSYSDEIDGGITTTDFCLKYLEKVNLPIREILATVLSFPHLETEKQIANVRLR